MVAVKMREQDPVEVARLEASTKQLGDQRLIGGDVEPRPRHSAADAWPAPRVDEDQLTLRLDDPRPHRERSRPAWIPADLSDQAKPSAVSGASFEEHGL